MGFEKQPIFEKSVELSKENIETCFENLSNAKCFEKGTI